MNLSKGSTMCLAKGGVTPTFKLGASWGKILRKKKKAFGLFSGSSKESVDLDLCAFGISNGKIVDECSFRSDRSVYMASSGDDRSGGVKNGDNEIITLNMSRVPANVDTVVMIINSYTGQEFNEIPFAKIRVYEGEDNSPVKMHCEYNIDNDATFVGGKTLVIGSIFRTPAGWDFKAIGDVRTYKTIDAFISEVEA